MKITNIIKGEKPSLSFEIFPPKTIDKFHDVLEVVDKIGALSPSYISVTYGAGGGRSDFTTNIASSILSKGVEPLAHLTCVSSTKEDVKNVLATLKEKGIENILALRGDKPLNSSNIPCDYSYASQLIKDIKDFSSDFCIGAACYPETHPESENSQKDIFYLKEKVEKGCEFLTTQMFFDNNILYNFMFRLLKAGVDVPIVAGIMPVTNANQIKRICSISNTLLPQRFIRIVERYGNNPMAMEQAGIAYATEQIIDLYANGINAVHVYSMNKPHIARKIKENIDEIIK